MFVSVEMWLDIVRSWDWHEFNNLYEDSKHIQSVQIGINSQKIQWAINLNLLRWSHPQHWHILELKLKRWFLASNLVSGSSGVACNTYPMPSNLIFKFDSNKYKDNKKKTRYFCPFDMIDIFGCWTLRPRTQDFPQSTGSDLPPLQLKTKETYQPLLLHHELAWTNCSDNALNKIRYKHLLPRGSWRKNRSSRHVTPSAQTGHTSYVTANQYIQKSLSLLNYYQKGPTSSSLVVWKVTP